MQRVSLSDREKDWYTLRYHWKTLLFWMVFMVGCVAPLVTWADLENPAPASVKSGLGVVSGWICDAEALEVSFDGGPRQFVPYGSERSDTTGACGDTDNGFGLLVNYNELGDGKHTVTLYIDGQVETTRTFTVVTQGQSFLRGVHVEDSGHYVLIELSNGNKAEVVWDEATQSFAIADYFTLDDILGRWEFSWQHPVGPSQYMPEKKSYEFTHIEMEDGYPILYGQGENGGVVRGGLVLKHLASLTQSAYSLPPGLSTGPYQFWIWSHGQDTQGRWLCGLFLMDVLLADDLPPGAKAEVLAGRLVFTTGTASSCEDTILPTESIHVSADRIE